MSAAWYMADHPRMIALRAELHEEICEVLQSQGMRILSLQKELREESKKELCEEPK